MPSVSLQPPKQNNLQAFLKNIEAKKKIECKSRIKGWFLTYANV